MPLIHPSTASDWSGTALHNTTNRAMANKTLTLDPMLLSSFRVIPDTSVGCRTSILCARNSETAQRARYKSPASSWTSKNLVSGFRIKLGIVGRYLAPVLTINRYKPKLSDCNGNPSSCRRKPASIGWLELPGFLLSQKGRMRISGIRIAQLRTNVPMSLNGHGSCME
jgi:hypothetical protein